MFIPMKDPCSEASNSSQNLQLKKYTAVGLKGIQSHYVNDTGQYDDLIPTRTKFVSTKSWSFSE